MEAVLHRIADEHGCDIIVNGVLHTLEYYLRLVNDPQQALDNYVVLLANDPAIKQVHKEMWNTLCAEL
jgi:DNA (cytosine-5)-methyltransferase 1